MSCYILHNLVPGHSLYCSLPVPILGDLLMFIWGWMTPSDISSFLTYFIESPLLYRDYCIVSLSGLSTLYKIILCHSFHLLFTIVTIITILSLYHLSNDLFYLFLLELNFLPFVPCCISVPRKVTRTLEAFKDFFKMKEHFRL